MKTGESKAITKGVCVSVKSFFVPERSDPEKNFYFFAYQIIIQNLSEIEVQLISRHWIISDANGRVEQVRGEGVIGEQPVLSPGEAFSYTSACPLSTPVGSMMGSYQMESADGAYFDAQVAAFTLALPQALN